MLIIVCGLQGTGKTTVAKKLAKKINASLLRTDIIRQQLIKKPRYTEKEKQQIYQEMFSRAEKLLKKGDVVLDATFAKRANREKAREIAQRTNTNLQIVETICPQKIVKQRIEKRFKDASQAQFQHYLQYKKYFQPLKEKHLIIDTSKNIDKQLEKFS